MSKLLKRHHARLSNVPDFKERAEESLLPRLTREQRERAGMGDPRVALALDATIVDQRTGRKFRYDPDSICPRTHNDILWYFGEQPRQHSGHSMWMLHQGPRQSGKTLVSSLCVDNVCAQKPAQTGLIVADHTERTKTLFNYISLNHKNRNPRLTPLTVPSRETNQLTYDHPGGISRVRCLSAQSKNVGIGRAPDVAQISEVPFIPNFDAFWSGFYPSMVNRKNSLLIMESTPAPMTEPSAETFKNLCMDARQGKGRWIFAFTAFYETTLNERPWDPADTLDAEEIRLLEMFGPGGKHSQIKGRWADQPVSSPEDVRYLTLENLAFRRETLRNVPEIRRWPDLFFVWYPTDPLSCWTMKGAGVIPSDVLAKHRAGILVPWRAGSRYMEYRKPTPGANYIISVDPAGYGSDHASFQVLECYRDRVYQAAVFACPDVDPNAFTEAIIDAALRFNNALVGVERNGVGLAVLALLERALDAGRLKNLYYDTRGVRAKPGWHASKTSIEESLGALIDELKERLVLYDEETVAQLADYRNDKLVKLSDAREILSPGDLGPGRRSKGHYDRASALALGCLLIAMVPSHRRPAWVDKSGDPPEKVLAASTSLVGAMTYNERMELRKLQEKDNARRDALRARNRRMLKRRKPRGRR